MSRFVVYLLAAMFFCGSSLADTRVIEDAEDEGVAGWRIYDNTPPASVENVDDGDGGRAVSLAGSGFSNGYMIGSTSASGGFNITERYQLSWRQRSSEPVYIYVAANTAEGFRFLRYRSHAQAGPVVTPNGSNITFGIGTQSANGDWHTITRDLAADLEAAQPGNTLIAVNGFLVRNSMLIDDIIFSTSSEELAANTNQHPIADPGSDLAITLGQSVTLDASASYDPDGSIVSYRWSIDGATISTSSVFEWTPEVLGDINITLTVSDDAEATSVNEVMVSVSSLHTADINLDKYEYVWGDDFDGDTLDATKWSTALLWGPYLPINNEQQLYIDTLGMHSGFTDFNPFDVSNGTLKITSRPTSMSLRPPPRPEMPAGYPPYPSTWRPYRWAEFQYNGPEGSNIGYRPEEVDFLSGIITSYGSFQMTHGYVEARAKVPAGSGLWPAFWLLNMHYVEQSPEIDVMEFLGHDVNTLYNTYHYFDPADNWRKISSPSFENYSADWSTGFHTYGLSWSPTKIIWYVDGRKVHEINEGDPIPGSDDTYKISNQAMYLIANLAVGGNWSQILTNSEANKTLGDKSFEIDYIRAYKKRVADPINLDVDYQLRFSDEFNGTTLDDTKWNTHFIWGPYHVVNGERQYYVDALGVDRYAGYSPFTVEDGVLSIAARSVDAAAHSGFEPPARIPPENDPIWDEYSTFLKSGQYSERYYTSGVITSYDAFKFSGGYAEMRARIPAGSGLSPAFRLLNGYYVGQQPEIEIMEVRGENPHQIVHSYHRRNDAGVQMPQNSATTTSTDATVGYSGDFHTYGLRWRYNRIDWYIDGEMVHTYTGDDVAYQVMYVVANLAVGGDFVSSEITTDLPASLDIDYIRVYQESESN